MLFLIEYLEHQIQKLMVQGKRWTEVHVLKLALHGMNAGRKTYLGVVALMFFAMVMALSFGAMLLLGAFQLQQFGGLAWTWPLGTSVVVFALSALIFLVTSRESTWLKYSGLKNRILEVYGPYNAQDLTRRGLPAEPAMQMADLQYEMRRSVDEAVQRRMQEEIRGLRDELRNIFNEQRGGGSGGGNGAAGGSRNQSTSAAGTGAAASTAGTPYTAPPVPPTTPTPGDSSDDGSSRTYSPDGLPVDEPGDGERPKTETSTRRNPPPIH